MTTRSTRTSRRATTAKSADAFGDFLSPAQKRAFARKLLTWYQQHKRALPWRETSDAYRIWVSEIMLQQTQVATVIAYFQRFIARFPTVAALAVADEREVMRYWEGLGYYRRARQMHRAAQVVAAQHSGLFPNTLDEILGLPGIGRYTAGAIASIAYDTRAPILEANTVRLYARLLALDDEVSTSGAQKVLWQFAEEILPARNCREFNQALMELGSLICTPRAPQCAECPVSKHCRASELGVQAEIPRLPAKVRSEQVHEAAIAVRRGAKVLLRERPPGERWAGLWDFLRFPLQAASSVTAARRQLLDGVHEQSGLHVAGLERITTLKHGVTRFRITLDCYTAQSATGSPSASSGKLRWVALAHLEDYPLSTTGRKLGRLLTSESHA